MSPYIWVLLLAVLCQGQKVSLPASSTAVEGDSFRLTCTVTGYPLAHELLTFRYGNTGVCLVDTDVCSAIQSKPRFSCGAVSCGSGQTGVYFLDINPVSRQDDRDNWRCQHDFYSSTGSLTVNYPPSITSSFPSNYTVKEQERLYIDCGTFTTPGQPAATSYEWTHPDGSNSSVLDISSINRTQRGQYTCTAANTLSTERQGEDNATVDVDVHYGPTISGIPTSYPLAEVSSLQVNCSTYTTPGNPTTTNYRWTGPNSFTSSGPVLSINSIRRNQAGRYTCTATNTLTPTGGSQATGRSTGHTDVHVQYLDSPVLTLDKTVVSENDKVTISCDVVSNPTVQMTITNTDNNTVLVEETTNNKQVTISRAQCLHNGTYVCSVDNQGANTKITSSRSLSVLCSPRHDYRVKLNTTLTKAINQVAVLIADFISNPAPNYTWYRYDGAMSPIGSQTIHRVINTESQTRLQINITHSRDYGNYVVVAQNEIGSSEIRYSLKEATQESATLPVSSSSTAAIVGGIVGGLAFIIIIVLLIILYKKGYGCRSPITKDRTQKNGQQVEEDNRAYDTIDEPRESQANKTYSGLEQRTLQHYTGLTLYENNTDDTAPEAAVSRRLQDKTPVTQEGVELHA